MSHFKEHIDKLELQKRELEVQLKVAKLVEELHHENPMYMLANVLHKSDCRHNHTDGCGWFYFSWEKLTPQGKMEYSKAEYLRKANQYAAINIGLTTEDLVKQLLKLHAVLRNY